jgi:hypothetical protein
VTPPALATGGSIVSATMMLAITANTLVNPFITHRPAVSDVDNRE